MNILHSSSSINVFSITFVLQAYDQHLNMILGNVEETVTTVEIDEETYEEIYKVCMCVNIKDMILKLCGVYAIL